MFYSKKKKKKRKAFRALMSDSMEKDFSDFLGSSSGDGENEKKERSDLNKFDSSQYHSEHNLDEFNVLFDLGDGSFANVSKVEHKETKHIYARKTVVLDRNELKPKSVVAEMESLFASDCDNILKLHFCIVEENVFYMFLEFMNCGSLADVKRIIGKVPEEMIANLSIQILKGLDYLHTSRKIVHRDLKPGNILLHYNSPEDQKKLNKIGKIVLADFGLAGFKAGMEEKKKIKFSSFVGTNIYMSPERLKGNKHSFDCDIWSIGLVLLELALGKFPIEINETTDIFWQMMQKNVESRISSVLEKSNFSKEFEQFVKLCLQSDPSSRPTAKELLDHQFLRNRKDSNIKFFEWIKKEYIPLLEEDRMKKLKKKEEEGEEEDKVIWL